MAPSVTDSWNIYWHWKNQGFDIIHTSMQSGPIAYYPEDESFVPDDDEEEEMSTWIEDAYDWVDENVFEGRLPGGYPYDTSQPYQPPVIIDDGGGGGGGTTPPIIYNGGNGGEDPMKGMVYAKHCGVWGWRKRKTRRRKKLCSDSDLKCLGALKGVLGTGKAFELWIATHS